MTINIFVLKGDLNGKIVVVRFFFCRVYDPTLVDLGPELHCLLKVKEDLS